MVPRRGFATKLLAALALPVLVLGAVTVLLIVLTTRQYMASVDQTLHRNLAARIIEQHNGAPLPVTASELFDAVMNLNPSTEVYRLDRDGAIVAHAAPAGSLRLDRVAIEPVRRFLDPAVQLPVYGDDPRDPSLPKVFSAAPIRENGATVGYLYAVLGGEAYRSVTDMLATNQMMRLSLMALGAAVVLACVVGLLTSRLLMRRLSGLVQAMGSFERSGFRAALPATFRRGRAEGDELDRLTATFTAMADRIAQQFMELERADEARRELVMHLSHDLRTPLATLQGYLETLLLRWERLAAEERRGYLTAALGFGERLGRMIADLFELARLDTADSPLRPELCAIDELIQDVGQKLDLAAERRGVALEAVAEAPGRFVLADIALVERALTNLVENAIKFTPSGGRVSLAAAEHDGRLVVTVADTGIGIPAAELPHVFDRFYRVDRNDQAAAGTGLGLAIVRRVAELHGGRVTAESGQGTGTTFRLELPTHGDGRLGLR